MAGVIVAHRLETLMAELVECLCAELASSPGGPTCFCGVQPGALLTMDFCDCEDATTGCGQAWLRLTSVFPSGNFPAPESRATSCRGPMAAQLQMGVTRCWAGMDEAGNPPSEAAQAMDVTVQLGDLAAMQRTLECCLTLPRKEWVLGQYTPLGPQGNCGGGQLTFTVWLPNGV